MCWYPLPVPEVYVAKSSNGTPPESVAQATSWRRLRHHVRIDQDHSRLTGRAGASPRCAKFTDSTFVRRALRPTSASSDPNPTRPSRSTASDRMARTSASVLRPRCAARTRRARWTSSGTFRTVKSGTVERSTRFRCSLYPRVNTLRQAPSALRKSGTFPARLIITQAADRVGSMANALDQPPATTAEWPALQEVLGPELLAGLIGVSASSTRRYVSGTHPTPDAIAVRLHFVALVVADLAGAYNEVGVWRWFQRPWTRLDGNTPARLLGADWWPDDDGPKRVRELAARLACSHAT